jgi:hypothetical protein
MMEANDIVATRNDLRPDPEYDMIQSIAFCIRDEDAIEKIGNSYKYFILVQQLTVFFVGISREF